MPQNQAVAGQGNPLPGRWSVVHCPHGFGPQFQSDMPQWSGVLQRLQAEAHLTFAAVDRLALRACGRRWCDFLTVEDYARTCAAVARHIPPHDPFTAF